MKYDTDFIKKNNGYVYNQTCRADYINCAWFMNLVYVLKQFTCTDN